MCALSFCHSIIQLLFCYQVDYEDQVTRLLSSTPQEANTKANALLKLWGFPNTYTLGKRLTELLVRG
jgi:hypothetical protein